MFELSLQRNRPLRPAAVALLAAAGLAASAVLSGCDRKATRAECTEMIDHYVDILIADDPELAKLPPAQQAPAREVKKAIKKSERSYTRVESQCETEVKKHEHDCAMKAKTPGDWEACID